MSKLFLLSLTFGLVFFTSCRNDDDRRFPISMGSKVTVANTFQAAMTNGVETPIETLFNTPKDALSATANVSDSVEFPAYLLGLYDIDINQDSITFKLVAAENDPVYSAFFRTLESGTTDRYYFTFDNEQCVKRFKSTNPSVKLRIDSKKVLVVEIGEGFGFSPGAKFTIKLK